VFPGKTHAHRIKTGLKRLCTFSAKSYPQRKKYRATSIPLFQKQPCGRLDQRFSQLHGAGNQLIPQHPWWVPRKHADSDRVWKRAWKIVWRKTVPTKYSWVVRRPSVPSLWRWVRTMGWIQADFQAVSKLGRDGERFLRESCMAAHRYPS